MDADTLRLILIVCGVALLAGQYFWERRREAQAEEEFFEHEALDDKREPRLGTLSQQRGLDEDETDNGEGDIDDDVLFRPIGASVTARQPASDESSAGEETPPRPLVLQLSVVAAAGARFNGPAIVRAAGRCRLEPGEMDIFHRRRGSASDGDLIFSMANLVKPGTFPFGAMAEFESPGLSLFTEIAGAPEDPQVLDEMLETARDLAHELGGVVLDDRRNRLSPEVENRLRQRVLALTGARSGLREQA